MICRGYFALLRDVLARAPRLFIIFIPHSNVHAHTHTHKTAPARRSTTTTILATSFPTALFIACLTRQCTGQTVSTGAAQFRTSVASAADVMWHGQSERLSCILLFPGDVAHRRR